MNFSIPKSLTFLFTLFFLSYIFQNSAISKSVVAPPEKDQFIENPQYSDQETPAKEKKLHMKKSQKAVQKAFSQIDQEILNMCQAKNNVFRLNSEKSNLDVVSFKNWNIPVEGKFTGLSGYLSWDSKDPHPKAKLLIDAGSWDSANPDRDSRVKYFLLKAHKKKFATAQLEIQLKGQKSLASETKDLEGKLSFRNHPYDIQTKSTATKTGKNWNIKSELPYRLKAIIPEKDVLNIIKFCNHKSLTPTVDLTWNLLFEPACP
jgi:hypothetical protein